MNLKLKNSPKYIIFLRKNELNSYSDHSFKSIMVFGSSKVTGGWVTGSKNTIQWCTLVAKMHTNSLLLIVTLSSLRTVY